MCSLSLALFSVLSTSMDMTTASGWAPLKAFISGISWLQVGHQVAIMSKTTTEPEYRSSETGLPPTSVRLKAGAFSVGDEAVPIERYSPSDTTTSRTAAPAAATALRLAMNAPDPLPL